MSEHTQSLRPHEAAWDDWLACTPHDFHHRAAYHALAERSGEGSAHMLVCGTPERFVAWPYLARDIDGEHRDGGSVYGYGGPVGTALDDAPFLARAWEGFRALWKEQRLVTLFTRFHPLLDNAASCIALRGAGRTAGGELLTIGRSVSIALDAPAEERRRGYRKVLRQEIAAARRAGLVVEEDADWTHLARFGELYRGTMAENAASERYRFDDAYLRALRDALGGAGHLAVARLGDEVVAAMLFTVHGHIAQAHLTGSDPRHRRLSPLKVLIDGVADLARERGASQLHLGAGRGGHEDSLFDFKGRFSPLRHEFVLGRWVLDRELHARLSVAAHPGEPPDARYFPAYRAPRAVEAIA